MDVRDYENFDLAIEPVGGEGDAADGAFEVRVLDSPAGEAAATFTLPFTPEGLENFTLRLAAGRNVVRKMGSSHTARARDFGRELYDAVFSGEVETCFHRSLDEADRAGKGLRVRLRLGAAPALAPVPWEFLYSQSLGRFLTLSNLTPVVRYADLAQRQRPLAVEPPLRILVLAASPSDYDELDVDREFALLEEATADLVRAGRIELHRVAEPSLSGVQQQLRKEAFHILHFIGHGVFDERDDMGVLALEDPDGRARGVSGEELGMMLHDHASLRMVVLNACEGSRTSADNPGGGVAQSLVRQGTSAVVAMQFEISDLSAIAFSHELYLAMADGYPVDAAVAEARKAVFARASDVEWGTPVLHLRASDGQIFDIEAAPAPADVDHLLARADRARRAPDATGTISAVGVLRRILALDPDNVQARAMLDQLDDTGVVTSAPPAPVAPSPRATPTIQERPPTRAVDSAPLAAGPSAPPQSATPQSAPPQSAPPQSAPPDSTPPTSATPGAATPTSATPGAATPGAAPPASAAGVDSASRAHTSTSPVANPTLPATTLPDDVAPPARQPTGPGGDGVPPAGGTDPSPGGRPSWLPWAVGIGIGAIAVIALMTALGGDDDPTEGRTAAPTAVTTSADVVTTAPGDDGPADTGTAWMDDLDPAWLVALPLVSAPSIDGFADEWGTDAESEWSAATTVAGSPGSLEGTGRLGWDESGLFVLATVADPEVVQQWHDSPGQLWQGDSVNMEVTLEAAPNVGDSLLLSDLHILLGPDDGTGAGPLAAINPVVERGGDFTFGAGDADDRIEVASTFLPEGEGYQLEARIPWEVLDLENPSNGTVLAANVNLSTVGGDGFAGMVSTNPARVTQTDSACWNRLLLWEDPEVSPDDSGVELTAGGASSPTWSGPVLTWDVLDDVDLPPPDCD